MCIIFLSFLPGDLSRRPIPFTDLPDLKSKKKFRQLRPTESTPHLLGSQVSHDSGNVPFWPIGNERGLARDEEYQLRIGVMQVMQSQHDKYNFPHADANNES